MLAAKMDLLMKKLESLHHEANQVMDSRMTARLVEKLDTRATLARSLRRKLTSLEQTTPTTPASVLSRVGIPSPTSPSVNSKV